MTIVMLFAPRTGRKRRLGFNRKGKSSFTVHRSEEVLPEDVRLLVRQASSMSSDGEGSGDGDSRHSAGPIRCFSSARLNLKQSLNKSEIYILGRIKLDTGVPCGRAVVIECPPVPFASRDL
ncbi:hypothetical protein FOCC_FOCC003285 [Frankliniella occidentalis]|nr:hypothetical protein FOCC_FOCC003285 [Frankliniella occidentalis]